MVIKGAYYNEIDPYAAQWLRNLIADGQIAAGDVDERSIADVSADDLLGYTQCHFFAGIGGWSVALRLAGWQDDTPVWTGSCPCQPFSVAGKQKGKSDDRHLWPVWFKLIAAVRPATVFGEQVAGAIAKGWLDDAANDLEGEGYACAAAVLPACSVGAPHKRDRLWFVGYAEHNGLPAPAFTGGAGKASNDDAERAYTASEFEGTGGSRSSKDVAYAYDARPQGRFGAELPECAGEQSARQGDTSLAYATGTGSFPAAYAGIHSGEACARSWNEQSQRCGKTGRYTNWDSESGICRLANGIPARTHKLRAYGNAIVPQTAAEFIKASMSAWDGLSLV